MGFVESLKCSRRAPARPQLLLQAAPGHEPGGNLDLPSSLEAIAGQGETGMPISSPSAQEMADAMLPLIFGAATQLGVAFANGGQAAVSRAFMVQLESDERWVAAPPALRLETRLALANSPESKTQIEAALSTEHRQMLQGVLQLAQSGSEQLRTQLES